VTVLVAAFFAGVVLMAAGFLSDWNERRDITP
jgi:archaellin